MNDLEDRLRSELAAWADEAPAPRPWFDDAVVVTLQRPARRARRARWLAVAAAVALVALAATLAATRDAEDPVITGPGLLRSELPVGEELGSRRSWEPFLVCRIFFG